MDSAVATLLGVTWTLFLVDFLIKKFVLVRYPELKYPLKVCLVTVGAYFVYRLVVVTDRLNPTGSKPQRANIRENSFAEVLPVICCLITLGICALFIKPVERVVVRWNPELKEPLVLVFLGSFLPIAFYLWKFDQAREEAVRSRECIVDLNPWNGSFRQNQCLKRAPLPAVTPVQWLLLFRPRFDSRCCCVVSFVQIFLSAPSC